MYTLTLLHSKSKIILGKAGEKERQRMNRGEKESGHRPPGFTVFHHWLVGK